MVDHRSLLRLLQLASPALPIGAFHFSQGLEHAVHAGWVRDETSAFEWIGGVGEAALATLDLAVLARLHAAWMHGDSEAVLRWSAMLVASRETEELRTEDRHLGGALAKLLSEFGLVSQHIAVLEAARAANATCHATAFALAAVHWEIPCEPALNAYAWTWAENQTLAAVKLVPLGQSAGQRILNGIIERIPTWVSRARQISDADIGVSTVRLGVGSGLHETQYSRLFRS